MSKLSEICKHYNDFKKIKKTISDIGLECCSEIHRDLDHLIRACEWYEKWKIDKTYYTGNISRVDDWACITKVDHIPNSIVNFYKPMEFMQIWFATGPYIFGNDYDSDFFSKFYEEIKNSVPKPEYVDDLNHSLYYSPENAAAAYENYKRIYKEYMDKNFERRKQKRMQYLRDELDKLEGNQDG